MSRCLVTGHRGYIGSEVFKQLEEAGHDVMGIDLVDGHDILECLNPTLMEIFTHIGLTLNLNTFFTWRRFQELLIVSSSQFML